MSNPDRSAAPSGRLRNRVQAWLSTRRRRATGFDRPPEPRSIGSAARGHHLLDGNFLFAGFLVEAPQTPIWDLPVPDAAFENGLHGFAWADDLAAVLDPRGAARLRAWTQDWIGRFGRGSGPGWMPALTGRRLIRWINHAPMLMDRATPHEDRAFRISLAQQADFLAKSWHRSDAGLPRIEALTGLVLAGVTLVGMDRHLASAARGLGRQSAQTIDETGAIATRSPEELAEIFIHLGWAAQAMTEAEIAPHPDHAGAIARAVPVLRALRHRDGGLARFHGGGRGVPDRLDHALAETRQRPVPVPGLAMGFARMGQGRLSLVLDAASPPEIPVSGNAHASTLAFELTSGRRPLIVNCGSGRGFGDAWRRAGRATASHSTLAIDGYSSARLGQAGKPGGPRHALLLDAPRDVRVERREADQASGLIAGHDGYVATHGLSHIRQIHLDRDGRTLRGEDVLATVEDEDKAAFDRARDRARDRTGTAGIAFRVRFHLHPDVTADLDPGGTAVTLALPSGEDWIFHHAGNADLLLEPSVYFAGDALAPLATRQIVLTAVATEYATRVSWTLAKARETPDAVRDLMDVDPPPDRAPTSPAA